MKLPEHYASGTPAISFELFPPKGPKGLAQLERKLPRLAGLGPAYFSVTYGAMGTTRSRTLEIAAGLAREHGQQVAHHLTCVGATRAAITETLDEISAAGIENIVALRGDPPRGDSVFQAVEGGFRYAAELVAHIRETGRFGIAVAGYPETHVEAASRAADIEHLATKVAAGADIVITQLFYDNADFHRFVERCRARGITCPIVPGLMPIRNVAQIKRITSMCGARIPAALGTRLEAYRDDPERVLALGVEHTAEQAVELLESGAPGIHFYVLNQDSQIAEIMTRVRSGRRNEASASTGRS